MFLKTIFLKNIRDKRMTILWWGLGFFLLIFLISSIFPAIQESAPDLESYIENLPDALTEAFGLGEASALTTPSGFLNAELYTLMLPIMILIFTIGIGSSAIAGEEESGTLDLLLSNPVSRWRLVVEKFLAMALSTFVIAVVIWLSFVIAAASFDMDISIGILAAATTSSALLGLTFGSFALLAGCVSGSRGMAVGVGVAVAAGSYMLYILSKIVDSLKSYEKFSLFFYNLDPDPLNNGLRIQDAAVFLGVIAVLLALSVIAFSRRDLSV